MTVKSRLLGIAALAAATALVAVGTSPTVLAGTVNVAGTARPEASSAAVVTASVIRASCAGGGSVVLRVEGRGDHYVLTASAAHLPVDGRWRGSVAEWSGDSDDYVEHEFRTTSVDGAWSVTRTVPAFETPYFAVLAINRGDAQGDPDVTCVSLIQPAGPFAGLTSCDRPSQLLLTASARPNGQTVVRYQALSGLKPGSRWKVTVAAIDSGGGSVVRSLDTVRPQRGLNGKVTFTGLTNPRLRLTVADKDGQRCTVAIRRSFEPSTAASLTRLDGRLSSAGTWRSLRELMAAQSRATKSLL